MADLLDIFGDEGTAEPEAPAVPKFLGVEQERLGKTEYSGEFVDFFSQYYGMGALKTLEYTGIDVDDPQNITELTEPTDILSDDRGKQDLASSGAKGEVFAGQSIADLKYNENPDHISKYGSYSGYLSGTGTLTDRLPTIGNITEPLFTGNFSDINFGQAAAGEFQGIKVGVQDLPSDLGSFASNFIKGDLTFAQSSKFTAGAIGLMGGPMALALGPIIGGETVLNAFGNPSLRPAGPLGIVADIVHSIQYNDRKLNAAARAADAQLKATVGSSLGTADFMEAGRSRASIGGVTGFEMTFSNGFGITRAVNSGTYTGNFQGMTYNEVKAMDALSHGFIPKGYDNVKETGTSIIDAGWRSVGYTGVNGESLKGQLGAGGYYKQDGSYMSANGLQGFTYGTTASVNGFAAQSGLTYRQALDAILGTRKGTYKNLSNAVREQKKAEMEANQAAALEQAKADQAKALADLQKQLGTDDKAAGAQKDFDKYGGGPDGNTGKGGEDRTADTGGSSPGDKSKWAEGGKVGYAFGTPPPGVQPQPSGFIDRPPSQVAEGEKVADNRDMEVKEGTYVLNAAAVEFAGEQDIRKMIMDAQKEAVRRGITQGNGGRASQLVDIAVSSGEVTIAPYLVKIIGEDRLEKINKRGLRKTEERIQRAETQKPQIERPVPAQRGGFI